MCREKVDGLLALLPMPNGQNLLMAVQGKPLVLAIVTWLMPRTFAA
jgi:hypothetical protein